MVIAKDYSGCFPNLCQGTLTLDVDGEIYALKDVLWSGGTVFWYKSVVSHGKWKVNRNKLPHELLPKVKDIEDAVNDSIEWGCCGGCL